MANGKYIVFGNTLDIIIFPKNLKHCDMARHLRILGEPVSAGFIGQCTSKEGSFLYCHGTSESLNLPSIPTRDSILANKALDILDDFDPIPACLKRDQHD